MNVHSRGWSQVGMVLALSACCGIGCGSKPTLNGAAPAESRSPATIPAEQRTAATAKADTRLATQAKSPPEIAFSMPVSNSGGGPAGPRLDWSELSAAGDVTAQVHRFMKDGRLDFGTGRIVGGKAITLTRAELQTGKLVLTIQVSQPDQVVRFEGLGGALGNFHPQGAQRRPVTIRGASHEERFVRRGVLHVSIPHPQPERIKVAVAKAPTAAEGMREEAERRNKKRNQEAIANRGTKQKDSVAEAAVAPTGAKKNPPGLIPGPETGYKPRSLEFTKLAVAVSAFYKMPGRDTFRPDRRVRVEVAQAALAYPNPKLQAYASKMLDRLQQDQAIDVKTLRQQLLASANRMSQQNLEYGEVKGSYTDSDGRVRNVLADGSEPDPAAQRKAGELRALANGSDEEIRRYVTQSRDQNTIFDLFFGDGISNRVDDLYQNILTGSYEALTEDAKKAAGPRSANCLVQLSRVDVATAVVKHVGAETLTDVVLSLSWGFSRSEKLQVVGHQQLVFIPIWKPNESLELQKIQLREPLVMHAEVNVYANQASSEGHRFSMPDPGSPPNNQPGKIVISEYRGFASIGTPRFTGVAWVEVDGKKSEWKSVASPLELKVEPGEYKVVVFAREQGGKPRAVKEQTLRVDGDETRAIDVSFEK